MVSKTYRKRYQILWIREKKKIIIRKPEQIFLTTGTGTTFRLILGFYNQHTIMIVLIPKMTNHPYYSIIREEKRSLFGGIPVYRYRYIGTGTGIEIPVYRYWYIGTGI